MSSTPRRKATPTPQPAKTDAAQVDLTTPTPTPSTSPAMPHERDEGAGMTGGAQSDRVQQGHRDLKRGVEDTSRAAEADATYRELKK